MLGNEGMIRRRQTMHSAGYRNTDGMIRRHHYFEFDVNSTQVISGQFSTIAGQEISVDWGDGSARDTYSGTDQAWSHDYGSAVNATVRIFGSVVLTKFKMDASGADISFDIANLPSGLTYLSVSGSTPLSGDVVNLPSGLTTLYVSGSNTLSGDVVNLPSGLTTLNVSGSNTIADYTSKTWTTKPATFRFIPVSPGGLSTAEIDQLLIDLDDDLTWASGDVITLTGTNAVPSSASDAAVNNMTSEGATVTTNT